MSEIENNLKTVQGNIAKACIRNKQAVRKADDVTLIAVSKKQPMSRVQAMLDAGQRIYGENRVQEAAERWGDLRGAYPDLELHLIGPLQTNKAADAVALFDVIQVIDREKLARCLAVEIKKQGRNLPCFIQVNTGEEPQKSGILPDELSDFIALCRDVGLSIIGLMCIPPQGAPPALHFAFLKKLANAHELTQLSMGMSGDYERAIPLGASHVRVGSALFGARPSHHEAA